MGRKKSRRSRKGPEEQRQPAAKRNEAAQPVAAKSEDEQYDEAITILRGVAAGVDVPETVRLAEQLRIRFPQRADGYRIGVKALRDSRRLDEADALLREAVTRFPDEAWPLAESAWAAFARSDWQEAIQRAEQLRTRFSTVMAGYRVAVPALRESRRFDESDELSAESVARFPDEAWPLAERVLVAQARGDWIAAIKRAEDLRARFPELMAGYKAAAEALRKIERFDDADALLRDATARFPDESWPLMERAWSAQSRGDRAEAIRLAAQLRAQFPAHMAGYRVAAMALRESGQLDEADALLRDAALRFPNEAWLAAERAQVARLMSIGKGTK